MVFYGKLQGHGSRAARGLTLGNWRTVLGDAATFRVLANSILIALPRTILALALATAFAWCVANEDAVPAPARGTARLHVLPAGAAVGGGVDAPRRAQCRPGQPVARRRARRPGAASTSTRRRAASSWAPWRWRRCCSSSCTPRLSPWTPRWRRRAWPAPARLYAVADQPAAPAARAPGLGHPLVRRGHGVLRAAAAPRHAGAGSSCSRPRSMTWCTAATSRALGPAMVLALSWCSR